MAGACSRCRTLTRRRAARRLLRARALAAAFAAGPARAADWLGEPPLRGSLFGPAGRWDGFYIGGTIGVGNSNTDFRQQHARLCRLHAAQHDAGSENHPEDWTVLRPDIEHGHLLWRLSRLQYAMGRARARRRARLQPRHRPRRPSASDAMHAHRHHCRTGTDTRDDRRAVRRCKLNDYGTVRVRASAMPSVNFCPMAISAAPSAVSTIQPRQLHCTVTGTDNLFQLSRRPTAKNDAIVAGFDRRSRHGCGACAQHLPARRMGIHRPSPRSPASGTPPISPAPASASGSSAARLTRPSIDFYAGAS